MKTRNLILALMLALSFALTACNTDYGKTVKQGRCVSFDGKVVKFVNDVNVDPRGSAKYEDVLVTFNMPDDPKEKGPDPVAGGLVSLNLDKKQVKVFKDGAIANVDVEFVGDVKTKVKGHDDLVKGKTFPMVDAGKNEVTVFVGGTLATFKIPAGYPAEASFWQHGDSVRIFFNPDKDKSKALRFMNITKTNIFKK